MAALFCNPETIVDSHDDLAAMEARVDSSNSTLDVSQSPASMAAHPEKKLVLTESEAIARARLYPGDRSPVYLTFSKHDRDFPRNWSLARKWYITCFVSMLNVLTCLCAGGYSSGAELIKEEFHVSSIIVTLGLSMYILGFAIGPLALAPLSEHWGRNPIYIWTWLLLVIFQVPVALAPNMGTIIVCRLIQGIVGSAPLTNTGGTVSDLWLRNESGNAMAVYGLSSTLGPPFALVLAGYLAMAKGWRWLFWAFMAIFGGFWLIMVFTLPETRHSIILEQKVHRVRRMLKGEGLACSHIKDASAPERKGLKHMFKVTLTRPWVFLFTEPITFSAAIYNGFIYGIVFLFNEAFPMVFAKGHGFNNGEVGLSFLGLCIGSLVAALMHPFQERYYLHRVAANDYKGIPEARMWMARWGAILLPISLFWFGWTSYPSVHWIVPIMASVFFGMGIFIVILAILNYVVDSYHTYAASALAGVILVRNVVGAAFPLFAEQVYDKLGWEWASSLLAFLSIPLISIPWIFFYHGEKIRMRSPWARENFNQDHHDSAPH